LHGSILLLSNCSTAWLRKSVNENAEANITNLKNKSNGEKQKGDNIKMDNEIHHDKVGWTEPAQESVCH
jgi:hypothetical protein